jgi:murein DD-endopeptidase MepM/ murein hydrolase activator NlpD
MNLKNENNAGKKVGILLTLFGLTAALFAGSTVLYAQETVGTNEDGKVYAISSPIEIEKPVDPRQREKEQFVKNIIAELRATQKELYDVNANMTDATKRLDDVQGDITTLSGQLANLSKQIKDTENLIKNVKVQIVEKENKMMLLYSDIEEKELAIAHQKDMLVEYLEALYERENSISDTFSENENISIAKLLLSNESVGEHLQQIKYLNILEQTGHEIFDRLEGLIEEIEQDQEYVDAQRITLTQLYERLKLEKRNLEIQKEAKENLLQQTRGEERIFAILLEESMKQQAQIQADLRILREALQFIQLKMEEMGSDFDPTEFRSLFSGEKISVYEFINATRDAINIDFIWPLSASRGISAYFRDASYAAVFGVRHNGIDIRVPQETIIRAPADGVVYKVRDNGFGYSYLLLAHKGGYITVYGHIPQFMVEPGEKIYKGQAVALSGGIPGSKGAGLMTTGAHLHFEIMKDGTYVDPLLYLPLSALPVGSIPEKYTALVVPEPPGGLLTVY